MTQSRTGMEAEAAHYAALAARKDDQWYVKYLYDRLSIIDNKTSALLRLNGVILGFVTVAVFRVIENNQLVPLPGLFLGVSATIFLLLFLAETQSFQIFYLRFDRVLDEADFVRYLSTFYDITLRRETIFRRLRLYSFLGTWLFSLTFLVVASWHALLILRPQYAADLNTWLATSISTYLPSLQPWLL